MKVLLTATLAAACLGSAVHSEGALAIDENQGDQWGWAAGYSTTFEAQKIALAECGAGCEIVVTFSEGCAAYAADQTQGSTVFGYSYNYATRAQAEQRAMLECRARDGQACIVRVWGCH